jgi:hypothetical protein
MPQRRQGWIITAVNVNVFALADVVQSETPVRREGVCVKRRSHMGGCLIGLYNQEFPLKLRILNWPVQDRK